MSNGLLTEEEVKTYLQVDETEIGRLRRRGKLTSYRVGGTFVRYRKDEVTALKSGRKFRMPDQFDRNWADMIRDFSTFYGAYILLAFAVAFLVFYFVHT
ncbi:MAG: hypothetical protein A3A73_05860 [Omnitrophica bacterium RIFCSPLOWO2_01_FULL_50_24]|nr:MAG: hypothetical protein A3A73_05860 [Omnitrophica bacterium RIFCSPLOWO2_01_FULL_50_24]